MHVKTIEGIVHNGQIQLQDHVSLPENAKVYVVIPGQPADSRIRIRSPRLADRRQAADFKLKVVENISR